MAYLIFHSFSCTASNPGVFWASLMRLSNKMATHMHLKMSKLTKKLCVRRQRPHMPNGHTFLCKFWHFQMAVFCLLLGTFTPNMEILWISVCSFWLCGSVVSYPKIYRLVPSPFRFEIRQLYLDMVSSVPADVAWKCTFSPLSVQASKLRVIWLAVSRPSWDF